MSNDGGLTWHDGELNKLAVPARNNSHLAASAAYESLNTMEVCLYFQDDRNLFRALRFSDKTCQWHEDCLTNFDKLCALSGSSIACASDSTYGKKRWCFVQSEQRHVQQYRNEESRKDWIIGTLHCLRCTLGTAQCRTFILLCVGYTRLYIYANTMYTYRITGTIKTPKKTTSPKPSIATTYDLVCLLTSGISEFMPTTAAKSLKRYGNEDHHANGFQKMSSQLAREQQ